MLHIKSIRIKLLLLSLIVSLSTLSAGLIALFMMNRADIERGLQDDAELLIALASEYIEAPLLFDDNLGGNDILSKLETVPEILTVTVLRPDSSVFGVYRNKNATISPTDTRYTFQIERKIIYHKQELGCIIMTYSKQRLIRENYTYLAISLVLFIIMSLFTVILAFYLQKPISEPIVSLTETAKEITESGKFSLRVNRHSNDEIGILYDEFNMMLEMVEKRDLELLSSQEFLQDLINSMPAFVFSVDSEGYITNANRAGVRDLGMDLKEILGKKLINLYPEFKDDLVQIQTVQKSSEHFIAHKRKRQGDNRTHYFSIMINPLHHEDGAVVQFQDLTNEVELELQLHQNQKLEALGQLTGGIAHDFNNQLSGILSFASLLNDENTTPQERIEYTKGIISSAKRSADLTKKLLSFSRKSEFHKEIYDLQALLNESVIVLERSLQKKVTIERVPAERSLPIEGDGAQIANAILNLGINARDAMPDGGILSFSADIRIVEENEIETLPPGKYASLSVSDTGTGIPPEIQQKIFEPFFTTKPQGKGTGMGLAAVFGTMKQHGGTVLLQSEIGIGTTFTILLPLVDAELSAAKHTVTEDIKVLGNGETVIVLDDEPSVRKTTSIALTKAGFKVVDFENGFDVIDYLKTQDGAKCRLMVSDNLMPGISGLETFLKVQEIIPNIQCIIISGFCSLEDQEEYINSGIFKLIQKPYTFSELIEAVALCAQHIKGEI